MSTAREKGNAAFRKGRWSDAIKAYSRAVEEAPGDPVPLANRAMACLKLDRFKEAAEDATAALGLDITPQLAQKARYRRAVALRGLGDLPGAKADLEEVLRVDSGNEAAKTELEEVLEELDKSTEEATEGASGTGTAEVVSEKVDTKRTTPGASMGTKPTIPTSAPIPTPTPTSTPTRTANSSALTDEALKPSGFAALRARQRPSYVRKEEAKPDASTPANTTTNTTQPAVPTPAPIPSDPSSTAPGAGLSLLRTLTSLPPSQRPDYLQHYTPSVISKIVSPILEPDSLAILISSLSTTNPDWSRSVLENLKQTPRWKMNAAMLSRSEKESAQTLSQTLGITFP